MADEFNDLIQAIDRYLIEHADEITDEKSKQELIHRYLEEHFVELPKMEVDDSADGVYHYLELAQTAKSQKKQLEYLDKALELAPDNVDVLTEKIILTQIKKPHECMKALEDLIAKEEKHLKKEGFFENVGEFWGVFETRPYMRVRNSYFNLLITNGMLRCAIDEGKELLRLCTDDNLGVRYQLMSLYAMIEDEQSALELCKTYDEFDEAHMLLPLTALYYKLNKLDKAAEYLKRLNADNKHVKKFMTDLEKYGPVGMPENPNMLGYTLNSYEELLDCVENTGILYASIPGFAVWALDNLPKRASASKSGKK